MIINNVGYNHSHDADFYIDRPSGSGDCLLLLLKTDTIFTIDGNDIIAPKDSFFLYPKGRPQYYRCISQQIFENDWVHFLFESEDEKKFKELNIPYETFIKTDHLSFYSFCVKSIAFEHCSSNMHKHSTIEHFMFLIFNKISEEMNNAENAIFNSHYEMLATIRNKIYSRPYEDRTIESTAHEVCMSKSTFQLLYKKQFGVTLTQDIITSRIDYAKMLLENTNINVIDVAKKCGYNNYAHFERQFRSRCGISPTGYRSMNKK